MGEQPAFGQPAGSQPTNLELTHLPLRFGRDADVKTHSSFMNSWIQRPLPLPRCR